MLTTRKPTATSVDALGSAQGFTRFLNERTGLVFDVRAMGSDFAHLGLDDLDQLALALAVSDLGVELSFDEVVCAATLHSLLDLCCARIAVSSLPVTTASLAANEPLRSDRPFDPANKGEVNHAF